MVERPHCEQIKAMGLLADAGRNGRDQLVGLTAEIHVRGVPNLLVVCAVLLT
jgi:hypothetical protein